MTLSIDPIPALKDNYIWTIIDATQKKAWVVDPGEAAPVNDYLESYRLQLAGIFITHHHWDHTNGILALKNRYNAPVVGSAQEAIAEITLFVKENDRIELDDFPWVFQVLAIPGHTRGHIAYYTKGSLFCGDTLFAAGCGKLFEGTAEQMYASLQKMAVLPEETHIYCAHEYTLNNLRFAKTVEPHNKKIDERIEKVTAMRNRNDPSLPSTLIEEKETNPFLRCDSPELIKNVEHYAGKSLHEAVEIFAWLRRWKDGFK